jgi:hypothetical protein
MKSAGIAWIIVFGFCVQKLAPLFLIQDSEKPDIVVLASESLPTNMTSQK